MKQQLGMKIIMNEKLQRVLIIAVIIFLAVATISGTVCATVQSSHTPTTQTFSTIPTIVSSSTETPYYHPSNKTIIVNTTDLIGKTTDTILVPIEVTGANDIIAWQFSLKTRDDDVAKIVFDRDSVIRAGAASSVSTVYWFDSTDNINRHIFGNRTLMYIAVTPRAEQPIPIEIYNVRIYETTGAHAANYKVINGTLLVDGEGSGITIGENNNGATILFGTTDENGTWITGEDLGIVKVDVPNYPRSAVYVYSGSSGECLIPESLNYFCKDEVYTRLPIEKEYYITYAVSVDALAKSGDNYIPNDLFVLHNIGGTWYETTVMNIEVIDGIIYVVIKTWNSGPFILGYDKGDVEYPIMHYIPPPPVPPTPTTGGSSGSSTWAIPTNLILKDGWNFISVPKYLDSSCDTAKELFKDLKTSGTSVLGYDPSTEHGWYTLSNDTKIEPLNGYWIYAEEPQTINLKYSDDLLRTPPVKTVYQGWNAIGICANKTMVAKSSFAGLEWNRYLPWDVNLGCWGDPIIKGGSAENSEEKYLNLGNGGWLYLNEDGVLVGNVA